MSGAAEATTRPEARPLRATATFGRCDWPQPPYAAADGYSEILVTGHLWEGHPEVTGASAPDLIRSACAEVEIVYTFQKQGPSSTTPPLRATSGTTVDIFGKPWPPPGQTEPLPFPRGPTDAVVVHNLSYTVATARCIR